MNTCSGTLDHVLVEQLTKLRRAIQDGDAAACSGLVDAFDRLLTEHSGMQPDVAQSIFSALIAIVREPNFGKIPYMHMLLWNVACSCHYFPGIRDESNLRDAVIEQFLNFSDFSVYSAALEFLAMVFQDDHTLDAMDGWLEVADKSRRIEILDKLEEMMELSNEERLRGRANMILRRAPV